MSQQVENNDKENTTDAASTAAAEKPHQSASAVVAAALPPLRLEAVCPLSAAPQPYSEPVIWKFAVCCDEALTEPFEVLFSYMTLEAGKKDIELDEFEIDPLPEGKSVFELEHPMPNIDDIAVTDLIASHGISITLRTADEKQQTIAFRGAEVVVQWADSKYEEEMPDEITPEMLMVRCVGVRGRGQPRAREE